MTEAVQLCSWKERGVSKLPFLVVAGIATGAAYGLGFRPWHRRWGATDAEVERKMALDEAVPDPTSVSTRAITIHAPAAAVWPWLVQMGDLPRAGYYSYTWIERMQGLNVENAREILPQYQVLHAGDAIDQRGTMRVLSVEPERHLVLGPPPDGGVDWLDCTWAFGLYPVDATTTRLVTRVRARFDYRGMLAATPVWLWPLWVAIDPGIFIMERKMLKEIKRLAEAEHSKVAASLAAS
jgi:hypothetical protein